MINFDYDVMTKQEALEYRQRWHLVNDFIIEEIRNTKPEVKLEQLRTMFASAPLFHWPDSSAEDEAVRERWRLLKDRLHG
jgi:hypothetical protein